MDTAIWKSADMCVVKLDQGGRPVAISMTVQPRLQMSACLPWPVCRITSGAIQYGVPRSECYRVQGTSSRGEDGDGREGDDRSWQ